MASQGVISIMSEFNWDVEYICQALIEARAENEKLVKEINRLDNEIQKLEDAAAQKRIDLMNE